MIRIGNTAFGPLPACEYSGQRRWEPGLKMGMWNSCSMAHAPIFVDPAMVISGHENARKRSPQGFTFAFGWRDGCQGSREFWVHAVFWKSVGTLG